MVITLHDLAVARQRKCTLNLGTEEKPFRVDITENLDVAPDLERDQWLLTQTKLDNMDKLAQVEAIEGENEDTVSTKQQLALMRTRIAMLKLDNETNHRRELCKVFCSRVSATNLHVDKNKKLPLDVDGLYESPAPTRLLEDILTALNKEGLVPNASTSP